MFACVRLCIMALLNTSSKTEETSFMYISDYINIRYTAKQERIQEKMFLAECEEFSQRVILGLSLN